MGGKRVVTAIALIPLLYLLVKYLPPLFFFLFVVIVVFIGQYEYYRFYYREFNKYTMLGFFLGFLTLLTFDKDFNFLVARDAVLSMVVLISLIGFLFLKANPKDTLPGVSVILFGVFYISWTLGHLIPLRNQLNGENLIFFILIATWGVDTGAYYFGKLFGRHKLSPVISPGKTVEGAIGGVISCIGFAFLARWLFLRELTINNTILIGLIFGVISQLGDLAESMLKRSAGVKDSGSLLPAHGGMLDRIDSIIFTIPVFYYYIRYFVPEITFLPV